MYKVLATLYALFLLFMYIYMKNWLFLGIAIACEVIATSNLKLSEGFTKWLPSTLVVVGYAAAFYFLSLTLKTVPVGVAYAVWSGLGIVAISIVAWFAFGQKPDLWGVVGMGLIIAGVVVLNTLSNTTAH
ncbi:small multidrug resistance pump/small multidrug resistance pump [Marisediminitalea aggregata]|uniref:Small multidrug resistance pump/small multidrug resistance pump n=2 Tax=Alteromonadaceae TaxID=72275 RepID=A0A1M5E5V4_9ALTE|nr:small multidrug resistance pump/small multidrug resistance pump [Marisediminitalea aggregata]